MKLPATNINDSRNSRQGVSNMLHALRGEQFRHTQNLLQSRSHLSSTSRAYAPRTATTGTLPTDLIRSTSSSQASFVFPTADEEDAASEGRTERISSSPRRANRDCTSQIPISKPCSGPVPPRSWTLTSRRHRKDVHETSTWRANAMSLTLPPLNDDTLHNAVSHAIVPTLTTLCLRYISSFSDVILLEDIFPFLPSHLRRHLIRDSAVLAPLPDNLLYPLLDHQGGIDGELIIVGPQATVHDAHFNPSTVNDAASKQDTETAADWDSPQQELSMIVSMRTLVLLSTRLTVNVLLSLPPTLTHVALVHLPSPVPIHRLPPLLPRLVVFDLSYNEWLGYRPPDQDASSVFKPEDGLLLLERVDWSRWRSLSRLGLRKCVVSPEISNKVNKGRWDDVQIIL